MSKTEWKECLLGDFIELHRGYDLTKSSIVEGPYPVVCSTSIMGYHNEFKVKGPGVVIGRSGTLGEVQYVDSNYWPHNTSLYVSDFKGNDPKFVKYFLQRLGTGNVGSGSAVPTLNRNHIQALKIKYPPLAEQQRIAKILSSLDDKIELNNAINRNLEEQAQSIFKSWFIDFEPFGGTMPENWKLGTVADIIVSHDSKRIPLSGMQRDSMKKIYPYYGATSLMDYVDNYIFDGIYLLLGEDGTVIDANGFPILQYVEGKFWVNNHAHILTGKSGYSVEMLYLFFSLTNVREIVTGAVQPKISQGRLNGLAAIIPDEKTSKTFDENIQPIFCQIRLVRQQNQNLTILRDTLLTKLMCGEFGV
jgi:type I restriction enzyme S subunit